MTSRANSTVLAPPGASRERGGGVQKLVACGFNVPPDALQKGEVARECLRQIPLQVLERGGGGQSGGSASPSLQGLLSYDDNYGSLTALNIQTNTQH